jgi:hypothetical protein
MIKSRTSLLSVGSLDVLKKEICALSWAHNSELSLWDIERSEQSSRSLLSAHEFIRC